MTPTLSNKSSPSASSTAIEDAIRVLYPSRYSQPHHNLNLDSVRNNHKRRFSPLLLEYGERELHEWGVVASSSSHVFSEVVTSSGNSFQNGRGLGSMNTVGNDTACGNSSVIHTMGKNRLSKRKKKTITKEKLIESSPSLSMKSIDGRLRLCSKSIVFEPNDVSRGIIRLPFDKMISEPVQQCEEQNTLPSTMDVETSTKVRSGVNGSVLSTTQNRKHALGSIQQQGHQQVQQRSKNVVSTKCSKFWVMKTNNAIGPYEIVEALVEFRFTFLHSNPFNFLDLAKKIYQIVHDKPPPFIGTANPSKTTNNKNGISSSSAAAPTTSLDSFLQPLYHKPFDPANYMNIREKPKTANLRTYLLGPLLSKPGCTVVTDQCIYFQPFNGVFSSVATKALHYGLDKIIGTARRYKGLQDCALELFFEDGPSVLLAFETLREREAVMALIPRKYTRNSRSSGSCKILDRKVYCHTDQDFILEAAQAWVGGLIGNFDYLLALNSASGRSFLDLSRYPVFPWVLADYKSSKLNFTCCRDLEDATTTNAAASKMFRDLTKPIGALNEDRLHQFKERWKSMQEGGICDDIGFLYGTHYSAPGYCLYYLVRTMPEQMLCLQNGKYDTPDRLFHSIEKCYASLQINQADLKECIPQFYDTKTGVDLLLNSSGLQFGVTQAGKLVGDVELPRWANSPKDFVKKNRMALESDYCTKKLPHWIDLIFGEKSRGEKAVKAMNLFHPFSYLRSGDLEKMETDDERANAEFQATEFGICPDMLFRIKHPHKLTAENVGDNWKEHNAVETDIKNCLMIPPVTRNQFIEESTGDKHQKLDLKDSGNKGQWEMLDAPSTNSYKTNAIDEEDTSILSAPTLSSNSFSGLGQGSNNHTNIKFRQDSINPRQISKPNDEAFSTTCGTKKGNSAWLSPSMTTSGEDIGNSGGLKDVEYSSDSTPIRDQLQQSEQQQEQLFVPMVKDAEVGIEVIKKVSPPLKYSGVGRNGSSSSPHHHGSGTFSSRLDRSASHHIATSNKHKIPDIDQNSNLHSLTNKLQIGTNNPQGWDFTLSTSKCMHGNAVSGCILSLEEEDGKIAMNSFITTTSLDGSLTVHTLPNPQCEQWKRRSFSSAAAASSSLGKFYKLSSSNKNSPQFRSFRFHESTDPLSCLTLVGDNSGGLIAFAGGEEGVVIAYGINSACALASVNSHRDAITGISLVPRPSSVESEMGHSRRRSRCTHVMTTCSFDATVKLWSVAITEGETVSINRDPLVELFDADSTVVCVAAVDVKDFGFVIAAGCSNESLIVWVWKGHLGKEIIYKEDSKNGYGACTDLKWAKNVSSGEFFLYAGFGDGTVASFGLKNGGIFPICNLQIGSPVQCLSVVNTHLLAGCVDGGLRLVSVEGGGLFGDNLKTWVAINGTTAPSITSIDSWIIPVSTSTGKTFMCATGSEDGVVSLFQIRQSL